MSAPAHGDAPALSPGWQRGVSRSTGTAYYHHPASNTSLWHDAALPAGWGWAQAGPDAPREFVELATGRRSASAPPSAPTAAPPSHAPGAHAPPAAAATAAGETAPALPVLRGLPAGQPQPGPRNVAFDVYVPAYRSREPWLSRQLGAAARAELDWWQRAAAAAAPVAAAAVIAAAAAGGVAPSAEAAAASLAAAHDALAPMVGEAAAAAAEALAPALIAAAHAVLGDGGLASAWDARTRRYVVRREAAPVAGATAAPSAGAHAAEAGARATKRWRDDGGAEGLGSAAAASAAAGGGGGGGGGGAGVAAHPTVRPASAYPAVKGAALYTEPAFHSNATIKAIYDSGRVTTSSGVQRKVASAVGPKESRHMYHLVRDNRFTRCLEVGMANGLSSLAICQALHDSGAAERAGVLVSIDPFQASQWDNTAVANLAAAGLAGYSRVREQPSYLALPALLADVQAGREAPFDLVFVDGMHLFDYTLLDNFYAILLLRPGGVLLLDDVRHRGVRPAYDFARTNYPHLALVADTVCADTLGTFVKTGPDTRSWDYHTPFDGGGGGGGGGH